MRGGQAFSGESRSTAHAFDLLHSLGTLIVRCRVITPIILAKSSVNVEEVVSFFSFWTTVLIRVVLILRVLSEFLDTKTASSQSISSCTCHKAF